MHPAQRAVGRQSRRLTPLPHSYPQIPPSRTLAACGPAPALLDAAHLTKGKADMRRLMVMALPLLLAIPVAAQEQDADDSTEIGSGMRSEERRVEKECVSKCGSRWSPDHLNKKSNIIIDERTEI